jgi:glycosyl hydrolase family 64 (putative beta-1,3-glucanase)
MRPRSSAPARRSPGRLAAVAIAAALAASGAAVAAASSSAPAAAALTGNATPGSPGSGAPPSSFWGKTGKIPAAKKVLEVEILNRTGGRYPDSKVFWSFGGTEKSIAQQPYIDMPANSAGRLYLYLGSKSSKYFDFIEFTVGSGSINVDTTRVDRWGLPLALLVRSHSGAAKEVGDSYAVFTEGRAKTFARFKAFVPKQFKGLAAISAPYGIPSPGNDPSFQPGGKYAGYFTAYAAAHGDRTDTTAEIFGCGGALSANPPLCAALNRHVAKLSAAGQQDPANFYKSAPANYYADFWHKNAIAGQQYGFPYDDDASQSSDISVAHPKYMVVAVGW